MVFKNNIIFLAVNILLTVIFINITQGYFVNIYNLLLGPFGIPYENLFSVGELKDMSEYEDYIEHPLDTNFYVNNNKFLYRIKGDSSRPSGVQDVEEGFVVFSGVKSQTQSIAVAEYLLLNIKEKVLIVRAPMNSTNIEFGGIILPLTPSLKHEIRVSVDDRSIDDKLLPFILDSTGNYKKDIYFQLTLTIALFAIMLLNYYKIIIRFINPKNHPIYKKIGIYGSEEEVAEGVNKEISDYENSYTYRNCIITTNWIIKNSLFRPSITKNYLKKE